jgi:hypothetical protein
VTAARGSDELPVARAVKVESSFSTSPDVHCGHATSVP